MFECRAEQGHALLRPLERIEDQRLRRHGLGENLWQIERLGDEQCLLDPLVRPFGITREEREATQLRGERCEILVLRFGSQHVERAVHHIQRLLESPAVPHPLGEPRGHACSRMRSSLRLEDLDRAFEVFRGDGVHPLRRECTGALVELRGGDRVVAQLDRPLGVTLRLLVGAQGRGSLARLHEGLERIGFDRPRILVIGSGEVGIEVVGRDDLYDLVLVDDGPEIRGGREVP